MDSLMAGDKYARYSAIRSGKPPPPQSFTARKAPAYSTSTIINRDWVRWYGVPDQFIIQAESDGVVQHHVWDNEKLLDHISVQLDMEEERPLARAGSRYGRQLLQDMTPLETSNFLFALNQPTGALRRQDSIDDVSGKTYKNVVLLGHNTFLDFSDAAENYARTKSFEKRTENIYHAELDGQGNEVPALPLGSRWKDEAAVSDGTISLDEDYDFRHMYNPSTGVFNSSLAAKEIKEHYAMGLNEALDTIKDAKDDQEAQKKLLGIRSSANYYEGESAWAHREGQNFIYALFQRAYTTDIARDFTTQNASPASARYGGTADAFPQFWHDYAAERAKVLTRGDWKEDKIEPYRMVISR